MQPRQRRLRPAGKRIRELELCRGPVVIIQQRAQTIPRREDERNLNLAGKHPAYCTCLNCTDKFLKERKIKPSRRAGVSPEKVKPHPKFCGCATCKLLGSVEGFPPLPGQKGGFFKRLLRKVGR